MSVREEMIAVLVSIAKDKSVDPDTRIQAASEVIILNTSN